MALLLMSFLHRCQQKYLTKRHIIFRCINSTFFRLQCLKFSFKLANISRSSEENLKKLKKIKCFFFRSQLSGSLQVSTLQLHDLPGCDVTMLSQCVNLKSLVVNNCGVVVIDSVASLPHLQYVDIKVCCCISASSHTVSLISASRKSGKIQFSMQQFITHFNVKFIINYTNFNSIKLFLCCNIKLLCV